MGKVWAVYFSPTENTKKIVTAAGSAAAERLHTQLSVWDITAPEDRKAPVAFGDGDLVFLGVPTYAGRVPNKMRPWLEERIHGGGAAGVPIVTYGGRSFDDALAELGDLMEENGFALVGGGSFVCAHAFAHKVAAGRPNETDLELAERLGGAVAKRLEDETWISSKDLPGNHPAGPYYVPKGLDGEPVQFLKAKPVLDVERCTGCGKCVQGCPMGSIDPMDFETKAICIKCQQCILRCPEAARAFADEGFLSHKEMLEKTYGEAHRESIVII